MRILLTGGSGMLGAAVQKAALKRSDVTVLAPSSTELNLSNRQAVDHYLKDKQVESIVHLAARVGGIQANIASPADFYVDNVLINTNLVDSAHQHDVPSLINIGSSCMYPRGYERAIREDDLLRAPLEPTNEGYALSKIGAAKHCAYLSAQYGRSYRTLIPCNLYGPHDDFSPQSSHLIAAIIHKLSEAKRTGAGSVSIWGTGEARREFLFIDDLADFIVSILGREAELPDFLNVGAGTDWTVNEYYRLAAEIIGFGGEFTHDTTRPVGMMRKLLDSSLAVDHGWKPGTSLADGLAQTNRYYQESLNP